MRSTTQARLSVARRFSTPARVTTFHLLSSPMPVTITEWSEGAAVASPESDQQLLILAELRAIRALMEARNSAGLRIASVPGIGA